MHDRLRLRPWGFVCLLFLFAGTGLAQTAKPAPKAPVFAKPHQARVEVGPNFEEVRMLRAMDINIDAVFDDWARVYVNDEERGKLETLGFAVSTVPDDGPARAHLAQLLSDQTILGPEGDSIPPQYHTYATLTSDLQQIAADHPDITRLVSLGQSQQGRELWMMHVSDNPDAEENEPEFAYISSMHGDEVVGKELMVGLLNLLTDSYGTDPRITNLVNDTDIWIMPSMNPDGTELGQRGNANFADLNRDFPDQFVDDVNTTVGRQPETAAIMNWRAGRSIVLSSNFHGGALVANYPFDSNAAGTSTFNPTPAPDNATFQSLARTYADNNMPMSVSNGHPAWSDGITNGADWYAINGGMQDWNYVYYGGFEVLMEVSNQKWPAASTLPGFWDENRESLLAYMERVHEGVRGIVTDADTGLPIAATIQVDANPFVAYTDPDVGDYHRVLMPGTYTLTFTAEGREPLVIPNVTVNAGPATVVDVAMGATPVNLQPIASAVEDGLDGFLEPGETAPIAVTLQNYGRSATGVSAKLIPTGFDATISRGEASFPNIDLGATAVSDAPYFEIAADSTAPAGRKLGFAVEWETNEGSGRSDAFFLDLGVAAVSQSASINVPVTIPQFANVTASSSLTVPAADGIANLTDIKVTVDISHTYVGDLIVDLIAPTGQTVRLHDRSGGSSDDIVGTYGLDLNSSQPLSGFTGLNSEGTWTLRVVDLVFSNGGTINDWSIEVEGRPTDSSTPELRFKEISYLGDDKVRLEWWAYPGLTGYRVYRSLDPSSFALFTDISGLDPNPADNRFDEAELLQPGEVMYFLVTGIGPGGEGPLGHYGQ